MRLSWALVPALAMLALWAMGCGDGDDDTVAGAPQATATAISEATAQGEATATPGVQPWPTGIPGTPGNSPQDPLAFGASQRYENLELSVDRWELVECLPPEVTPTVEGEECPEQSLAGRFVRFFATVRNTSTTESANGRFDFALVFRATIYTVLHPDVEDNFPAATESLGPGETIEGWVYSFRPPPEVLDSGEVRTQTTIGPFLEPRAAFWWEVPLP